jgi:hypothetical protein
MAAQPGGMHRQLFAQFDWRSLVAQPGNEEFHAVAAMARLSCTDERPAKQFWSNLAI